MTESLTIGLVVMASAATATSAAAAPYVPARTGLFATWRGAQSAAGFRLVKPTYTHHLSRNSEISVARCEISKKKAGRRLVIASYGKTANANLTISQNNSNGRCTKNGRSKRLGKVKIHGATAILTGVCDAPHLPKCTSVKIFLFLHWRKNGVFYQASSFGERRGVIIAFAKGLRKI